MLLVVGFGMRRTLGSKEAKQLQASSEVSCWPHMHTNNARIAIVPTIILLPLVILINTTVIPPIKQ